MRRRIARILPKSARTIALLVVGETLLSSGLWLAWHPLAPIVLGLQVTTVALLRESTS